MRNIESTNLMELWQAVETAVNMIHSGVTASCISTQFGIIPFEVTKSYDPMYPVLVYSFDRAPSTNFVIRNRSLPWKWYVELGYKPGQSRTLTMFELASGFCECLLWNIFDSRPSHEEVNALLVAYVKEYASSLNPTELVDIIAKRDIGIGAKVNKRSYNMFIASLKNSIKAEVKEARILLSEADNIYMKHYREYDFGCQFYDRLMGLILCHKISQFDMSVEFMKHDFLDEDLKKYISSGDIFIHAYNAIMLEIKWAKERQKTPKKETVTKPKPNKK